MIELKNISKSFDNRKTYVVNNLSMSIAEEETLVLLGSSGCGKTTTLKMINRLVSPTSGQILIDNKNVLAQDLTQLRRSIGYVFQGVGLFPHMTIAENISIVLRLAGKSKAAQKKRAEELLTLINLEPKHYANRYPHELSGGQQQRVGVARGLAADPKYLLMDEPFGALDAITRSELQDEMIHMKQQLKKTIVFVTHDIAEALKIADRIAVMHQGHLEQIGTADALLNSPSSQFVKDLFAVHTQQVQDFIEQSDQT